MELTTCRHDGLWVHHRLPGQQPRTRRRQGIPYAHDRQDGNASCRAGDLPHLPRLGQGSGSLCHVRSYPSSPISRLILSQLPLGSRTDCRPVQLDDGIRRDPQGSRWIHLCHHRFFQRDHLGRNYPRWTGRVRGAHRALQRHVQLIQSRCSAAWNDIDIIYSISIVRFMSIVSSRPFPRCSARAKK